MSCDTLGPMTSDFYLRSFQIATAAILGYLLLRVLDPLSGMLGWAAVLAFILHPLHERLTRRFKGRRALSAGILTALTPFLVLAPLSVLAGAVVGPGAGGVGGSRGPQLP